MRIFLIIKCGFQDSFDFVSQISKINEVAKIFVFRDAESQSDPKVQYILPQSSRPAFIKHFLRFFQILTLRKLKPNIIIGIYELPHGLLAMLSGKVLGVPSVVSIIGNPAYTKLRKGFRMKLTMWVLRNTDFVTVTGSISKQFLIKKGIPEEKVFILPNTLEFENFRKIDDPVRQFDVISLGRISSEKHVEMIVRIVAILHTKLPEIKAAIAGSGPELENIKKLVTALNLENTIRILGYIPDEQLEDFYNSGRVFVLTSETEGFPRTIVQAAACGVPVVASNVGDISDIIEDKVNGFLIAHYDADEEYAERVLQLLTKDTLYSQFSEKLMKKVKERFSHQCATEVWKDIILNQSNK
jgi:glycosyltransferase involved in cell wall biosynthesis